MLLPMVYIFCNVFVLQEYVQMLVTSNFYCQVPIRSRPQVPVVKLFRWWPFGVAILVVPQWH